MFRYGKDCFGYKLVMPNAMTTVQMTNHCKKPAKKSLTL